MAHQDVLDLLLLEDLVIDRKHRAAGIAENVLDALIGQRLDHHLGAASFSVPWECSVTAAAAPQDDGGG